MRDVVCGSRLVVDDGLELARAQGSEHVRRLLVRRVVGVLQVLLGPILARRTGLSTDGLAVEHVAARDVRTLEDHNREVGIIVCISEGNLLGTLVADGDGANRAIEGLATGNLGYKRIEGLVLNVGGEAELFGDLLDKGDVIALDLAVLLILHRSIIRARGNREGARGDELVLV